MHKTLHEFVKKTASKKANKKITKQIGKTSWNSFTCPKLDKTNKQNFLEFIYLPKKKGDKKKSDKKFSTPGHFSAYI